MKSILPLGWSRESWSGVGTRDCSMFMPLKNSSLNTTHHRSSHSVHRIATGFLHSAETSHVYGTMLVQALTRKKIIRLLIEEIMVDVVADKIELVIHWHGGDHTRLSVKKDKAGQNRWVTDADVVEFVRVLARHMPDQSTASVLNRSGKSTGRGNSWTSSRVSSLRHSQGIEAYREGERAERGEVTLNEAAR